MRPTVYYVQFDSVLWQVHGTVVFSVCPGVSFQENIDNHCIFLFQQNVMNADPVGFWCHYGAFLIETAGYTHLWWTLMRGVFIRAIVPEIRRIYGDTDTRWYPACPIHHDQYRNQCRPRNDQYGVSFYTYQGTHHTNKRSTVRCQGWCVNPAQPRWVAGCSRRPAVRIKNLCRKNERVYWRT